MTRVGVVVFPGTNCERDVAAVLGSLGAEPESVWHRETDLTGLDGVVLPGGFAHGDYLRTGAIARFSPVMDEVARLAREGRPVLGICNGFQILCESGLLPGALTKNAGLRFVCRYVHVRVEDSRSVLTAGVEPGRVLRIPLNSYEGNYLDPGGSRRVVLRYCTPDGQVGPEANPNGSAGNIAGVSDPAGNVVGLMPHPERASDPLLGSDDGLALLGSFVASLAPARV